MKRAPVLAVLLAGCLPADAPHTAPAVPMTLPLADGRADTVLVPPFTYVVSRQPKPHGFEMRVTRDGRDFDYSEGLLAKRAAEAWCAKYNRSLAPRARAHFSVPNAWVFDGDCA